MPYEDVSAFTAALRRQDSVAARCIEFITLTAARAGEAINATWDEVNGNMWIVPASRMKSGSEHRVPLSGAALAVLESMRAIRDSDYIFPGRFQGRPVGHAVVRRLAKQAAGADITVHGLRSTFRDWAAERTSFPRRSPIALAHAVGTDVEPPTSAATCSRSAAG